MTPERSLARIHKLLALAAAGSGAAEEEARTAALTAVRMMIQYGLAPGSLSASSIDRDEVTALAFRVVELEQLLADRQAAHRADLRDRELRWKQIVEQVRQEGQAETRKAAKKAATVGAVRERRAQARAGNRERNRTLHPERKREIARAAARARWKKWREGRGI